MIDPSRALRHAERQRAAAVRQLEDFIRLPSVSAQPARAQDVARCARWLAARLRDAGLTSVQVLTTPRHPIVYGEWRQHPALPTLLVYGHYDVQPPEPLDAWSSPPFEPTRRGSDIYGRGACDDKGQLFTHVKAIEAYLRSQQALPVNVKCLFEGEEEIGSPHLARFIARHRRRLAADVAVMSDTRMLGPDRPAISYAERGSLYLELEVRGPRHDLHSGNFGGVVHDPVQALCEIVAQLHTRDGAIAVPGVYRRVRHWSDRERASMAHHGPSDRQLLLDAQSERDWGEPGYSLYERLTLRPALTLNGISGGYEGPGTKGVIPSRAIAKLSFRLVPDQDPAEIDRLFREHVTRITPLTVHSTVRTLSSARPALLDPHGPAIQAAAFAYRRGFGAEPVLLRSGGTIPILNTLQEVLGLPTVLMGFALPDDRMHAPNEKFHLPNFFNGIATSIWFLAALGTRHLRNALCRSPGEQPAAVVAG